MFDNENQPVLGFELTAKLTALEQRFDKVIEAQAVGLLAAKRQILDLRTQIAALTELLAETTSLDLVALQDRRQAARAEAPFGEENPQPTTAEKPVLCTKCWLAVEPQQTVMTARGSVCDRCAR